MTALLENGMYYIPVCGMYASYICTDIMHASYIYTDIMHASYYGAYIDDYTIFQTSV